MRSGVQLIAVTVLGLSVLGCAAAPTKPAPVGERSPTLRVTVRHLEGEDAWEVHYRLPEPVTRVAFARARYPFRTAQWTVASPSTVKLERLEEGDVLSSPSAPFQEVTLKLRTYFRHPEKDYQLFIPYTDGGLLLYTGQFDLATPGEAPPFELRYTLVARSSERLVLLGKVFDGSAEWTSSGDGTYVYFGNTSPVVTQDVVSVVDVGLPRWLRDQTEALIPRLFAFYSQRLRAKLNSKPVVFISYGEEQNPRSHSFGGGTLPGVVQLEFRLPRGLEPGADPSVAFGTAYLIAHESAHLWNAQLFRHQGSGNDWLHEGSADAFALRALRELKVVDDEQYWAEQSRQVSKCLLGLEGQGLKDSSRPGRTKNHYSCGATLNLLAEAASLHASGSREDLFAFWAKVFAVNGDGTYDDRSFLKVLGEAGGHDALRVAETIVNGPSQQLQSQLRAELDRLGVHARVAERIDDPEYQLLAGARAAFAVVAWDCGRSMPPEPTGRSLRIPNEAKCSTFTPGQHLDRIDGHLLATDGVAAYDDVAAECARSGEVKAGTADRLVTVRCGEPRLPKRPAYLHLSSDAHH